MRKDNNIMEETKCKCGNNISIDTKAIWKHDNTHMIGAISVLTLQCNKCREIIMITVPHNIMSSKEEHSNKDPAN